MLYFTKYDEQLTPSSSFFLSGWNIVVGVFITVADNLNFRFSHTQARVAYLPISHTPSKKPQRRYPPDPTRPNLITPTI